MTHDDAFLRAIIENPDDDSLRLVYADYLDERGDPRGEFIRVQIALAGLPDNDPRRGELEARERQLLEEHKDEWVGRIRDWVDGGWCFRRGMLAISINAPALLAISAKPGEDDWFRRGKVLEMHVRRAAEHIDALARSPHLARLASLSLSGNGIGDVHVNALAASPHLAGLTALDLSHNFIGGGGIDALATTPNLPALTWLDLSHNHIDDADMRTLADSSALASLAYLNVSNNPIVSPEDLAALLSSPRLPRLALVDLRATIYTDEGRRALRACFGDRVHP
jgi:uncharacterized protein (TIGR02996 family)